MRSELRPWLRQALLLLLVSLLGWWCIGRLPARVSPPLPVGHWLSSHQRPDRTLDIAAAWRDVRGESGPSEEILAAILVREVGADALTPDPPPDLLAALGVPAAPPRERILPLDGLTLEPQEAAYAGKVAGRNGQSTSRPGFQDAVKLSGQQPWRASDLPSVAAWLDAQQPLLASALTWQPKRLRIPWTHSQDSSFEPVGLRLSTLRPLGQACASAACRALGQGDLPAAVRYAAALYRMGAMAAGADGYDTVVIGFELLGKACDVMDAVLQCPDLSDRELAPWMDAEATPAWGPDPGRAFDRGGRLRLLAPIQDGFQRRLLTGEPSVVISRVNEAFDRVSAIARLPSWSDEQREWATFTKAELSTNQSIRPYSKRLGMLKLMIAGPYLRRNVRMLAMTQIFLAEMPDLIGIASVMRRVTARLALIRVALGIRQQSGPGNLPPDPFGDGPVRAEREVSCWRIWSVGSDGAGHGTSSRGDGMELTIPLPDQAGSSRP